MTDIAAERKMVVEEALTWVGTPYAAGGDVKGAGVDCGMLLVRVFVDLKLVPPFDPRPYPSQWHMHQVEEKYLGWVEQFAQEIEGPYLPGDILMYKFGNTFSHGTIVIDWPFLIHAVPFRVMRGPVTLVNAHANLVLRGRTPKHYSIWADS